MPPTDMAIEKALAAYLESLDGTRSPNTIRAYANGINAFKHYLEYKKIETTSPLTHFDVEYVISFPRYLAKNGYSNSTMGVYLASVKVFMDWLVIEGYVEPTYSQGIRIQMAFDELNKHREKKLPRWPKPQEIASLLDAVLLVDRPVPQKERDIALVYFFVSSGCRNAEVCGLKIRDIDMKDRSAKVTGKGRKERIVYFDERTADALRAYWTARKSADPASPVFARHDKGAGKKRVKPITTATARNVVLEVMDIAGIIRGQFTPHYFRHAFAIRMLKETGNLAIVQDLMGHASPASTRIYAKIAQDDLRDAHRKVYISELERLEAELAERHNGNGRMIEPM